jgi:hypothetical protein
VFIVAAFVACSTPRNDLPQSSAGGSSGSSGGSPASASAGGGMTVEPNRGGSPGSDGAGNPEPGDASSDRTPAAGGAGNLGGAGNVGGAGGAGGSAGVSCPSGSHTCGGQCVAEGVDSCGAACVACADVPNAAMSCQGGKCVAACGDGFAACGGPAEQVGCPNDIKTESNNCGACARTCEGQKCTAGICTAVRLAVPPADEVRGSSDSAFDGTDFFYASNTDNSIRSMSKFGDNVRTRFKPPFWPHAATYTNGSVYFTGYDLPNTRFEIYRGNPSGSTFTRVAVTPPPNSEPVRFFEFDDYAYWTIWPGDDFVVERSRIGTGVVEKVAQGTRDRNSSERMEETGIYWLRGQREIMKTPLAGGNAAPFFTSPDDLLGLFGAAGGYFYWGRNDELWRKSTSGSGDAEKIADLPAYIANPQMSLKGDTLYLFSDAVVAVSVNKGGRAHVVAPAQPPGGNIYITNSGVDDKYVYWMIMPSASLYRTVKY